MTAQDDGKDQTFTFIETTADDVPIAKYVFDTLEEGIAYAEAHDLKGYFAKDAMDQILKRYRH